MISSRRWISVIVAGLLTCCMALVSCGQSEAPPVSPPEKSPLVRQGETVFSRECSRCHSVAADTVIVGPSLWGIADRAGGRVAGLDETGYLLQSILAPDRYLVAGYEDLMPADMGKKLTGEELDAVVAYLLSLHK